MMGSSIVIKNLAKDIDSEALFDTFGDYGTILSCKVVTDTDGESRGYGFIHFDTKEAAANAIAKVDQKSILGKVVTVCHFKNKSDRPATSSTVFTNVYVKDIDPSATDAELEAVAATFGTVTSMCIMKNPADGVSKGFAFINYDDQAAANEVRRSI